MKNFDKKEKRVLYSYLAILLFGGACIALAGYQYYKNFEKHFKTNIGNQLNSIADLKVSELEHWLEERRGDAETVFGNKVFAEYVKRYLKSPKDSDAEREIKIWMKEFRTGFNYDAVILTDPQLVKKIIIPEAVERPVAFISPGNIDSLREGKLVFEDFYKDELKQKIFLNVLIPILDERRLVGVIELRIDPKTYLYPILSSWPVPSETSEILILRHEGNEAVYLNELRFQKNTALNLRIPIEDTVIPAVRAVLGYYGFMEGRDYRGKAVVTYVAKVPNSPWFLVAKSDESEVYAPLRNELWQTLLFGLIMFAFVGLSLGFLWRNQRTLYYKERIKSAENLQKLNLALNSSQEIVFLTDIEGTITYINPEFTKVYGYTAEEVVGVTSPRILNSGKYKQEDSKAFWDILLNKQPIPKTEYFNKCKDGKLIEIEGSATPIINTNGDIIGFLGFQRDITERKRSELEQRVLHELTRGIATTDNLHELLKLIHQSLAKLLYADNYFIALHDQASGLFSFPYYVDQFDSTPEPVEMAKSCTAYVFRTGKPLLITPTVFQHLKDQNEVELVGSPSPSWVGVPLHTHSRTIGVLVLQHYEKENVYSEQDVRFLESVGNQIAIIIEHKRAEEDLRNAHLLLRTVIDNIPDSIYSKDIEGRKTLANLTELRYSGAKSDFEIIGKTDFDLYPKVLAEGFFADDQRVMQTGQPVINREEFVIDDSGQKHWLLTSKLPMKDEKGNIIGLVGIGRDITEARQAMADLQESEIKLNVILQSTADGILAVDGNGKVIKTNNRFAELWHIPQALIDSGDDEALIGFVLNQLTNPDEFISKVQKLYHTTDEDLDHLYFKDSRTFERFSAPLVMPDSSIGRVWSFRDITKSRQAVADLQESETRLKVILQSTADGILAVDTNGKIISINKRLVEFWQIPQPIIDEGDTNKLMHYVLNQVSNGYDFISIIKKVNSSLEEYQDIVHFKDGHIFERYSAPMVMDNALVGRVWSFRDITTRTLDEERLRRSEKQFRSVLESVSLIGLMLDVEGKIILCNDFLLNLTGWTRQDVLFLSWFDLFIPQEVRTEIQAKVFERSVKEGKIQVHYENEIVTRSGEKRLIAWNSIILHDHLGVVTGVASIGEDITDRKKAEAEIKLKNEELLKINSEKDKFFSIIAHDLRSPFNGFLGLTRIMADGLPGFKADELQELAVRMQNSATNLFRLLENLLHWSQMQQGIFPFNPTATRLLPVVNEIISLAEESANSKNISISNDIPGDLDVFADNAMLQTVIRNLLSNALKFTHRGGKISISAKVENEKFVAISVMDSGIGMDATMVNNLFSLNAQTNRQGTEKESSSGLGLLLCKEFVEKQGGKLWVESETGKGSTFSFTIPFSSETGNKNGNVNVFPSDTKGNKIENLKILIAEDDETSDFLITMAIKPLSKEILKVKTGIEAVEACRKHPGIDLVLMDIKMPVMDGYEATRQIREFDKDIVIIAQTAFSQTGERERAMEAGCNDYILKPLDLALLNKMIQKHCTHR